MPGWRIKLFSNAPVRFKTALVQGDIPAYDHGIRLQGAGALLNSVPMSPGIYLKRVRFVQIQVQISYVYKSQHLAPSIA